MQPADYRFYVSFPPHILGKKTIKGIMYNRLLAVAPAVAAAIYYFRMDAFKVMILSVLTALACEAGMQKFLKRDITIADGSAVLTGLLLAFLLSSATPWWIVVVGAATAIILGKQIFGGLGNNPFCDALVGWLVLRLSWPERIAYWMEPHGGDLPFPPLEIYKFDGLTAFQDYYFQPLNLFLGCQAGPLGTVFIAGLLAGGLYLLFRRVITWHIPAGFLGAVTVFSGILWLYNGGMYLNPLFHLLGGTAVLGAFFLATDPTSSPVTRWGKLAFGVLCGVLIILIRTWGKYPDGVAFAIVLGNAGVPLLNKIRPRPYGKEKEGA